VNRSSYYNWLKSGSEGIDPLEAEVCAIFDKSKGTYGWRRITQALRNKGFVVNHKKVYRIMKKLGLKSVIRKKTCYRKYKKENIAENKLNREFTAEKPMTKLIVDVSEMKRINDKRYYFLPVIDLFDASVVTFNVSNRNDNPLVMDCLEKAKIMDALIHSDQGIQFTSNGYRKLAEQNRMTISMSRVGNCYDNAAIESFFGHFKEEFYIFHNPKSEEELKSNIKEFVDYYNNERIHSRLKMSPAQYSKNYTEKLVA
jgi:transposase InsO family protein